MEGRIQWWVSCVWKSRRFWWIRRNVSSDGPRLVEQDVWLISEEDVRAAETEDEGGGGRGGGEAGPDDTPVEVWRCLGRRTLASVLRLFLQNGEEVLRCEFEELQRFVNNTDLIGHSTKKVRGVWSHVWDHEKIPSYLASWLISWRFRALTGGSWPKSGPPNRPIQTVWTGILN